MKINSEEQLRQDYDEPKPRVRQKTLHALEEHSIEFISLSPFLVLSTIGENGKLDASPRGGVPGFVKVLDETTLLIPDSKGNNLLDSLSNIVQTGRVGMLFLIPGMDETLRVNGKATISKEPALIARFEPEKQPIKSCIVVEIEELFMHCAKALMRSHLWGEQHKIERSEMPSMGQILKDQLGHDDHAETREEMLKRYESDV